MARRESGLLDPVSYYDRLGEKEWERLEDNLHGELEFDGTIEYLKTHLPDDGHILDAGGGAGRYTSWLMNQGYQVTLLDISREQLRVARDKIQVADRSPPVDLLQGTIDRIPLTTDQFDATLCLGGPLSHLVNNRKRRRAITELSRVTAPSSPVFVSVMGRLEVIQTLLHSARKLELVPELAATGSYDADLLAKHDQTSSFVDCHFFRVDEFKQTLRSGGLDVEQIVGLEGIASLAAKCGCLDDLTNEELASVRNVVTQLREDPAVADFSSHILAVCRA